MGISKYENAAAVDDALDKGVEAWNRAVINNALDIIYDNSASGLEAENVQNALNELDERIKALESGEPSGDEMYIYYGTSAVDTAYESVIKGLEHKELTNNPYKNITIDPRGEYCYYALPKKFDTVQFETVGTGGFKPPAVMMIDGEEYYVYRSIQTLTGTITIKVKA